MDPDNAAVTFMNRVTQIVATSCSIVEVVIGTAVLGITWHQPCDRELHLWVLVLIVRVVLRAMLQRYIATRQEADDDEETGEWNKAQKLKECLDVFGLIWFTIGNAWVFSSQTCATTAPMLYYTSLAIIVVTYVLMLFPIILAFAVLPCLCLCFPCVANYLWGEDHDGRALRLRRFDLDWSLIPVREYKSEDESLQRECAICLNDFTDGDAVRVLQCSGHHCFHQECIDTWLTSKALCPCCREYAARPKPSVRRSRQNRQQRDRQASEDETKDATADDALNNPAAAAAAATADQLSEGPSNRSEHRTEAPLLPTTPSSRVAAFSRRVSTWWRSGSESLDSTDDAANLPRNDSFGRVEEGRPRTVESLPTPPAPRANVRPTRVDSEPRLPPLEHRSSSPG